MQINVGRRAARMVADRMFGEAPDPKRLYQSELTLAGLGQTEATICWSTV